MTEFNINDKVRINFSRDVYKKGREEMTNFVIGTVEDKVNINHGSPHNPMNDTTYYNIIFDEEYFLEYSREERINPRFKLREKKYMDRLSIQLDNPRYSDSYLLPISMCHI
jgi:hypothetical protein